MEELKAKLDGRSIRSEGGCLEWQGCRNKNGYGKIIVKGVYWYTHRLAYTLHRGDIPADLEILHSCDNPSCIDPEHLNLGTHSENMKEKTERGGSAQKLTIEDVMLIRQSKEALDDLASRFSVTPSTISKIRLRRTWRHI